MNACTEHTPVARNLLRRSLQAGFVFYLAKGCAWLLVFAYLGERL